MKIAFFSNFLNHHQLPFCLSMHSLLGDGFVFVATEKFNSKAVSAGFADMNSNYSFCLKSYENHENYNKAMALALESDVAVFGSAPAEFMFNRLDKTNKLTFRYSERLFKPYEKKPFLNPANISHIYRNLKYKFKPYYLLAASAYAPIDYFKLGFSKAKIFKWGYFPPQSEHSFETIKTNKNNKLQILWVGRLLDLKRPEHAIYAAEYLLKNNIDFQLTLIGDGNSEHLISLIKKLNLENNVALLPPMEAAQVRAKMEQSDIFLFTSDYSEGWGAVLNEAMASGLACVASHSVGSAGFLIENGVNGFVYEAQSLKDLCEKTLLLCKNDALRMQISKNAYTTITTLWNGEKAAQSLIELSGAIINNTGKHPQNGPGSPAKVISQKNMYSILEKGN